MNHSKKFTRNKRVFVFLGALVLLVLLMYPIPYYIEGPGSAENVDPMIQIEGIENDEIGTYMLTTIAIQKATPISYFKQYLPFYEIVSEEELLGTLGSRKEYQTLQNYYMESSTHSALKAGFDAADKPAELTYYGVYVMSVREDSDFLGSLEPGDIIIKVDGKNFANSQEFIDSVKKKDVADTLSVTYKRQGKENEVEGKLIPIKETGFPGIGISLVDQTEIITDPVADIKAGAIGGPSAGFMFALRTYTLLTEFSLSKDYQIAGTGTIDEEGNIGRIGGIDKKIVAADKQGATVFFAPDDEITEEMREAVPSIQSNYEIAKNAARAIKSDMKVIPVKHLQDAIDYLNQLP